MTKRRVVAYALMLLWILKHLMTNEYGPFDRLIEIGIFVLIAGEITVGLVLWWKHKRHAVTDALVLKALNVYVPNKGVAKGPEEISELSGIKSLKKILASLDRLKDAHEADYDTNGDWHKISR